MTTATADSVRNRLDQALSERILLLDGAMGSLILAEKPTEADYRGSRFASHAVDLKNANDVLVLTQPDLIGRIHRDYLAAGRLAEDFPSTYAEDLAAYLRARKPYLLYARAE